MIKIGWDAGHGGFKDATRKVYTTQGQRTPDGEPEWVFNDIVGRAFANELALYEGVVTKRFDDPSGKTDVPLGVRTNRANAWNADYYISFHHNTNMGRWGNWTGVETYVYTAHQPKSMELAEALHPTVVEAYGLKDRGIKKRNLHIVRETKMPAVIIEGGFMDSVIDINKLRDRDVLENVGRMVAQALATHIGLKNANEKVNRTMAMVNLNQPVFLNEIGRKECRRMIKRGVAERIFLNQHENVDKYSDVELLSYVMAYLNRKTR